MTSVDLWAAVAATVAGACLGLRGELLKPDLRQFVSAPPWVFVGLLSLSAILLARAISLSFGGGHANAWEALVYSSNAITSAIMVFNVIRQRSPSPPAAQPPTVSPT